MARGKVKIIRFNTPAGDARNTESHETDAAKCGMFMVREK